MIVRLTIDLPVNARNVRLALGTAIAIAERTGFLGGRLVKATATDRNGHEHVVTPEAQA